MLGSERAGRRAQLDGLIYFGVEREALLVVKDIDADVVALLPELFAAGLAGRRNEYKQHRLRNPY